MDGHAGESWCEVMACCMGMVAFAIGAGRLQALVRVERGPSGLAVSTH